MLTWLSAAMARASRSNRSPKCSTEILIALTRRPEIVLRLRVPKQVRALEHPRGGFDGRRVERDDPVARLVLAPSNVHEPLDEIHVAPAKVLDFDGTHRLV